MTIATNTATSLADLKAAAISNVAIVFDTSVWAWTTGNFTGQDDDINIVKANSTALSVGAWVRSSSLRYKSPIAGAVEDNATEVFADRVSIMRFIPRNLRAGIRNRTGTTDLASYVQSAVNAVPLGTPLYFPNGVYRLASTISRTGSVTLIGDPARENFDNSWANSDGGTVFDCQHVGDAFLFQAANAVNSRCNIVLRDFTVRGGFNVSNATGHGIKIDGRQQNGTAARIDIRGVHIAEAAQVGLLLTGGIYGGTIDTCSTHRCGTNGFKTVSAFPQPIGEIRIDQFRLFQNGQRTTASPLDKTGFVWLAGTLEAGFISSTESLGYGAVLGGGPIRIGMLQTESNGGGLPESGRRQIIIGQPDNGTVSADLTVLSAPGAAYQGAHIEQAAGANGVRLSGFLADSLSGTGRHIIRAAGAGSLDIVGLPSARTNTDASNNFATKTGVRIFARGGASGTTGGGGTPITLTPVEIVDEPGYYSGSTFTAPINTLYSVDLTFTLDGLTDASDVTLSVDAPSFARTIAFGRVSNTNSAAGPKTYSTVLPIPVNAGDLVSLKLLVAGGAAGSVSVAANSVHLAVTS